MNKTTWILIISAIVVLIVIFNNSKKDLRDAEKRTDASNATEAKTTTLPNSDPTKPPVVVTVPPTANYNVQTFKLGQDVYAGTDMDIYLNPNASYLDKSNIAASLKKGQKIGVYINTKETYYTFSRQSYAYNYLFPLGPYYIPVGGPVRVYIPKTRKVYTK